MCFAGAKKGIFQLQQTHFVGRLLAQIPRFLPFLPQVKAKGLP
jgi:hypothetical protein